MKHLLPIVAFTLPLAAPLAAQELPEPIPAQDVLERMCSPQGAMQFTFGQTGVPGSDRISADFGRGMRLPAALAPFVKARPRSTEWSDRLMEMAYSLPMPAAESGRANELTARLAEELAKAGWERIDLPAEQAPLYLAGYGGETVFSRPAEGDSKPTRVLLAIDRSLGDFTLTCGRDDLLRAHASEAFGDLPAGTPRPQVPDIAVPAMRSEAECDDPAMREKVAALVAGNGTDAFMATMLARTKYRDRLTTWMAWKLESSGRIEKMKLVNLMLGATGSASPGGNPFAALAMFEEMLPIVSRIGAAEKSKDPAAICRALIPFHAWMTKVDAITLKQTQGAQAALAAEAKKLGISLD